MKKTTVSHLPTYVSWIIHKSSLVFRNGHDAPQQSFPLRHSNFLCPSCALSSEEGHAMFLSSLLLNSMTLETRRLLIHVRPHPIPKQLPKSRSPSPVTLSTLNAESAPALNFSHVDLMYISTEGVFISHACLWVPIPGQRGFLALI